ncbi:serine hydrolase domain-containing protein [Massilia sp. METH4]|uniref:serine hydrolase domain-containing protein n=1 Tax=Massilia sp. METH4 TaxID=3123041 RepID=UPI0030CEB7C3
MKGTAILGAALLAGQALAAGPGLDRKLAAIVADPARPLSGLAVLAVRDGKVAYTGQFGLARIGPVPVPVTPRTMFRIASISKMMTALGLMRLVEEGKVSLDEDIGAYLGYPVRNPHFPERSITLRHLLTHTSSLRDDAGYSWGAGVGLKDMLRGPAWAAQAPPGSYFSYCNLGWGVIGTVMERVTGERFDLLMRRLLLDPMGLRGGYNPSAFAPDEVADTATLYRRRTTDTEVWNPAGPWIAQVDDFATRPPLPPAGIERYVPGTNATPFSPTGGLRISAGDLGKVMLMLVDGGQHEGRRLLKPETLALMFAEHWRYDGTNGDTLGGLYHSWGLGVQRFADFDGKGNRLVDGGRFTAVGHLGEAYGLISTFAVDLANRNGIVSLIGGVGNDPERDPGRYSAHTRAEEAVLTTLYRGAVAP